MEIKHTKYWYILGYPSATVDFVFSSFMYLFIFLFYFFSKNNVETGGYLHFNLIKI